MTGNPRILTIENKEEEKSLRKRAADFDFSKFSKKEIRDLIAQMRKIMKAHNGVGLSANQIGLNLNMFVAEFKKSEDAPPKIYAVFNPKIEKFSAEKTLMEEGCLSVPGIYGEVERPEKIVLTGLDRNEKPVKIKARGILARIFQHETDHLNGVLFIDKATKLYEIAEMENEQKEPF